MLLATVIVAGCNDGDVNTEPLPTPSAVASAVVGEAAMGLNASGRFAVLQSNAEDELNSGQAVTLANAYTKQFLPYENKFLEKQRGGSIDLKSLGSCGRPLYAASAFEKLPDDVPLPQRRPFGAYWLVTMCARGVPQVSLAVSALATDVTIENGQIHYPFNHGGEFLTQGIPVGHQGEFPSTPEQAVVRAASFSNRHATNVPDLIMPWITQGVPQEARWHVVLDAPADVRNGSKTQSTGVLYSGSVLEMSGRATPTHFVADSEQPSTVSYSYIPAPYYHESDSAYVARLHATGNITFTATRKLSKPVKFDIVSKGESR